MRSYRKFLVVAVAGAALLFAGCGYASSGIAAKQNNLATDTYGYEMRITEANQQHLDKVQPPPTLSWSLERQNIIKRTLLWNDANRVSYIYLMSQMGQVIAFYAVKGKVSSVDSELTDPTQIMADANCQNYGNGACPSVQAPSPQMDGSYGTNGGAIFFFTTAGTYVEWNGIYLLSTYPLHLSTAPVLIQQVK